MVTIVLYKLTHVEVDVMITFGTMSLKTTLKNGVADFKRMIRVETIEIVTNVARVMHPGTTVTLCVERVC